MREQLTKRAPNTAHEYFTTILIAAAIGIAPLSLPAYAQTGGAGAGAGTGSTGAAGAGTGTGGSAIGGNGNAAGGAPGTAVGATGGTASPAAGAAGTGTGTGTATGTVGPGSTGVGTGNAPVGPGGTGASQSLGTGTPGSATGTPGSTSTNGVSGTGSNTTGTTTGQNAGSTGANGAGAGSALPVNPNAPAILDLSQTITLTLNSSNDLMVATKNLDRDRYIIDENAAGDRPKANLSASATHLDGPVKISFGPETIVAEPQDTQLVAAQAVLPVDISGAVRAATDAAKLQALADKFTVNLITNNLILKAQTFYFGVLRAQHQVDVARAALANAQSQATIAQSQYNLGTGQKIDMLRANTQVAQAQNTLLQAENSLSLAQTNLNNSVGRPLGAPVTVRDVPGVTTGASMANVPAVAGPPISPASPAPLAPIVIPTENPQLFSPPLDDINAINVDTSIGDAIKMRPELRSDLVAIQAAEKQIQIARTGNYPTFSLAAGANYYPTTSFEDPKREVESLTATVNIPLYDGGISRDRIHEARDLEANAKSTYASNQTDVELQVRQAYLNLQNTAAQISAANTALQEAVAARQLAQVRYANGIALYLEVTDAESALTSAEGSQVNAVYDYMVALAQFRNALGNPTRTPTL